MESRNERPTREEFEALDRRISLTRVIQGSYYLMPQERKAYIKRETDKIFGKVSK